MKISILIYSLASGGAERVVSILLKELSQKYEIELVLMNDTIFYEVPKNVKVTFLENSNPNESGIKKLLKLPFLAYKYSKIKSDISISFMNRPNYINVLSNLFKKSKTVISERGTPSEYYKYGLFGIVSKFLIKTLYKKADVVIANSKGNSFDLKHNFGISDVKVIYNSIEKKDCENKENNKFIFITVGRIDEGKNHKLLIESFNELDLDAELWIIGEGPLKKDLEKIANQNVKFLGKQKDVYKFLSKADCFVFSSNYEGFPNVLLEAMSCNLPIISTDCKSGPREILAPRSDFLNQTDSIEVCEYGILVQVGNKKYMKQAMKIIYENKELRYNFKQISNKRLDEFITNNIIKKWERVINE